jgi:16S rRNA (uracil1498-N3)-methyltransferase
MIFLYSAFAGEKKIVLEKNNDTFDYLTKVKRHAIGEEIAVRNLEDNILYTYIFEEITKTKIILHYKKFQEDEGRQNISKNIHLFWGICDVKTLQKTLPFLNELEVARLTFVICKRSQNNFVHKLQEEKMQKKLQKILENSCQQCGRNSRMEIDIKDFSSTFDNISARNNLFIFDFPSEKIFSGKNINAPESEEIRFYIGPEGGFAPEEKDFFQKNFPENIFQFSGNTVLRSETAAISACAKIS